MNEYYYDTTWMFDSIKLGIYGDVTKTYILTSEEYENFMKIKKNVKKDIYTFIDETIKNKDVNKISYSAICCYDGFNLNIEGEDINEWNGFYKFVFDGMFKNKNKQLSSMKSEYQNFICDYDGNIMWCDIL